MKRAARNPLNNKDVSQDEDKPTGRIARRCSCWKLFGMMVLLTLMVYLSYRMLATIKDHSSDRPQDQDAVSKESDQEVQKQALEMLEDIKTPKFAQKKDEGKKVLPRKIGEQELTTKTNDTKLDQEEKELSAQAERSEALLDKVALPVTESQTEKKELPVAESQTQEGSSVSESQTETVAPVAESQTQSQTQTGAPSAELQTQSQTQRESPAAESQTREELQTREEVQAKVPDTAGDKEMVSPVTDTKMAWPITEEQTQPEPPVAESQVQELSVMETLTQAVTPVAELQTPVRACETGYVYVYTLPEEMNSKLVQSCTEEVRGLLSNMGLGQQATQETKEEDLKNLKELFLEPARWFKTTEYGMEVIYHARLLQHPCRTTNPEKATVFFLPFYANVALRHVVAQKNETLSNELPNQFVAWLTKQQSFLRNGGDDHFIVVGNNAFNHMTNEGEAWGSHLLKRPAMENVTKLAGYRNTWDGTQMGIPYPTFFHPSTDDQVRAWQSHVGDSKRRWLVSFIGSKQRSKAYEHTKAAFLLRAQIMQQCEEWEECGVLDCHFTGMGEKTPCKEPAPPLQMQISSDFCLQPPGDLAPRKAIFDGMVAGCIPVFFRKESAYFQYLWHLPAERETYSVLIDKDELQSGNVTLREVLSKISKEKIVEMRNNIINNILPNIIIADPATYALVDIKDGVDRALEGMMTKVLRKRAGLRHDYPNPYDLENLSPEKAYAPLQVPS